MAETDFAAMDGLAQEAHLAALPDDASRVSFLEGRYPGLPLTGEGAMPAHLQGAYLTAKAKIQVAAKRVNTGAAIVREINEIDEAEDPNYTGLYKQITRAERERRRLDLLTRAAMEGIELPTEPPSPQELAREKIEQRFSLPQSVDSMIDILAQEHAKLEEANSPVALKAMADDLRRQVGASLYDAAIARIEKMMRAEDPTAELSMAARGHVQTLKYLDFLARREDKRAAALARVK
jgi:hypothetical protein